jgi:acetoin utilization deacetylase AcuC-like enzyme
MPTYLIYSDIYLGHDTGPHPESALRLSATMSYLRRKKWLDKLTLVQPRPASPEEISCIHDLKYIKELRELAEQGGGYLDGDTPVSEKSYQAALYAAGGVITAVDKIMETGPGNPPSPAGRRSSNNAFCLVRPPGHHARPARGMGFCLFNNVAVAAYYARQKYGLKKIAVIDWDLHHGNGTQEAFWNDQTVLFCSLHRYPYYPGSGSEAEKGAGPGAGFTVNIPIDGSDSNRQYLEKFTGLMNKTVRPFKPELIFISAGFDSYKNDPLGGLGIEIDDYARLTRLVRSVADEYCQGRLVSALEGGYDLQGLPLCIESHLSELIDYP